MKLKDRSDTQPQRAQRVDYNRLKHERAQENNNQKQSNNSNGSELHKYAHSFHYQSDNNNGMLLNVNRLLVIRKLNIIHEFALKK